MSKMNINVRSVLMATICVCALCCLSPTAEAATGTAVYYDDSSTPPACQGMHGGGMVTGVKRWLWNNGKACGSKYRVQCIGPNSDVPHPCTSTQSIEVTVVDYCEDPCNGDFNLSHDAFAAIANLKAGNIKIDYSPA